MPSTQVPLPQGTQKRGGAMRVRTPLELAAAVRGRRHSLKISQERLAVEAGVSRSFLARFENGHTSGGIDEVFAVLEALELELELRASTEEPAGESTQSTSLDAVLDAYERA